MATIRFLERLRKKARKTDEKNLDEIEELISSIIDYVSKILNTRRGSSLLDEEFGIPDFTSMGVNFSNEDMPRIEKEIASFVERNEPRLHSVVVKFMPDEGSPLQMSFSLDAQMSLGEQGEYPIHLVTKLSPLGQVSVSQ